MFKWTDLLDRNLVTSLIVSSRTTKHKSMWHKCNINVMLSFAVMQYAMLQVQEKYWIKPETNEVIMIIACLETIFHQLQCWIYLLKQVVFCHVNLVKCWYVAPITLYFKRNTDEPNWYKLHLGMGNSEYRIRRIQIPTIRIQNTNSNRIIGFGLYPAYKLYHVAWSQIFFCKSNNPCYDSKTNSHTQANM